MKVASMEKTGGKDLASPLKSIVEESSEVPSNSFDDNRVLDKTNFKSAIDRQTFEDENGHPISYGDQERLYRSVTNNNSVKNFSSNQFTASGEDLTQSKREHRDS